MKTLEYIKTMEKDIMKAKTAHKKFNFWLPRQGSSYYFNPASDDDFKAKHPFGYIFLVILGLFVLIGPTVLFSLYAFSKNPDGNAWIILGWIGAFIFGIGLFNFVAIVIDQYLGHLVIICSFIIGMVFMAISLHYLVV